jgi:hypothetical protein
MGKVIYMDRTINYLLESGKEKELAVVLDNSVLKEFEKMVKGNFIPVHYAVVNEKDKDDSKDEKEIK